MKPVEFDPNAFEDLAWWIRLHWAIATRYDKLAESFLGAIYLAATVIWLN